MLSTIPVSRRSLAKPNGQAEQPPQPACSSLLLDETAGREKWAHEAGDRPFPAQAERLRIEAERLGLTPEDLARTAVTDLLAVTGEDFKAAADRVLKKNQQLYRRLA